MVTQVDPELPGTVEELVEAPDGIDELVVGAESRAVPDGPEHAGTAKSAVTAAAVIPLRKTLIDPTSFRRAPSTCIWTMANRREFQVDHAYLARSARRLGHTRFPPDVAPPQGRLIVHRGKADHAGRL